MVNSTLPTRISESLQTLVRRNPFDTLRQEMDDLIMQFSSSFGADGERGTLLPSMDFIETEKAYEVKLDVPGFKPDEVHVEVQGNTLLVSGEHKEETEEKNKIYHRLERRSGSIRRSITLPASVNSDKIVAQCHDGILTVTLPKTEEARSKKIPVKG